MTTSLPLRVFYHNLRFLFLPFLSVLELWLVLAYVNRTEWIRRDWAGPCPGHPRCISPARNYQPLPCPVPV